MHAKKDRGMRIRPTYLGNIPLACRHRFVFKRAHVCVPSFFLQFSLQNGLNGIRTSCMKRTVRTKPSWINEQAMIAGTDPPLIALLLLIIRFPLFVSARRRFLTY